MKFNKITDVTKIIIFAATVIIVCVMVALAFKMVNEGKSAVSNGTNQYNNMAAEYSDINISTYDGNTVLGSEVANLITKTVNKSPDLCIKVITKAGSTTNYNRVSGGTAPAYTLTSVGATTTLQTSLTANDYINPASQFLGKVYKNTNGLIVIVEFTQQ